MTARKAIHKLRRHLRDYGLARTLGRLALYPLSWLVRARNYRISRLDLTADGAPTPGDSSLQYRIITADDGDVIGQIEAMEEWLEGAVTPRLRAGDLCIAALEDGRLAGFQLVTFGRYIGAIDLMHTARPGSAWVYFVSVRHDLRRQGIAAALLRRLVPALRQRGVRRLYSGAMTFNRASLLNQQKAGYRELVDVHYRRILWISWRKYCRIAR